VISGFVFVLGLLHVAALILFFRYFDFVPEERYF
jgi:hypothetical protein